MPEPSVILFCVVMVAMAGFFKSLLDMPTGIRIRDYFKGLLGFKMPMPSGESIRIFRGERAIFLEFVSFAALFGIAAFLLEFHRFMEARIFFIVTVLVLAIRLLISVVKHGLWLKSIGIGLIFIISISATYYLLGVVDEAQSDRQTEILAKAYEKQKEAFKARDERQKSPPPETSAPTDHKPDAKDSKSKLKPQSTPVVNPLEIVAFNSRHKISIANNGTQPIYVVALLVNLKGPMGSKSFPLGFEIKGEEVHTAEINDQHRTDVHSIDRLADTFEEHLRKAIVLYQGCGLDLVFYSPTDTAFKQIKDFHAANGKGISFDEVSGVMTYRIRGVPGEKEQRVPIVVTTMISSTCPR